jgi:glycosyltransferase involved in cell wall biosynthesis
MRILLVSDPYIPVPPKGYGGIERVIELLALQFIKDKHEVVLLAGPNSVVKGSNVITYGENNFPPMREDKIKSLFFVWKYLWGNWEKYDLVINFGRLTNIFPILNHNINKVSCYQREITACNVRAILALPHQHLKVVGCSKNLIERSGLSNYCTFIHNCVDFSKYELNCSYDENAPLIFLGRLERIKGVHIAIAVAKKTNNKLIIAGNISHLDEEKRYYENEIKPLIDGNQIVYIGQVDDEQKNYFLGISKALLFPIEWDEPFGIVMVEAMACGTPVIGFNKGSVPEVVNEGVTGFIVNTTLEMEASLSKLNLLDRSNCRSVAASQFDVSVIGKAYLDDFVFNVKIPKKKA